MSIRVYQLAKELGLSSKDLIAKLHTLKVDVKGHMSALDDGTAEIVRQELIVVPPVQAVSQPPPKPKEEAVVTVAKKAQVKIPITVKDLAVKLQVKPNDLIKTLMKMGIMANINQALDEEVAKKVAVSCGFEIERFLTAEESALKALKEVDTSKLIPRAPVVTMMGHVDHGKTSLLDAIRETNVTSKEAGGITQHIGAYEVVLSNNRGRITFLDTPGHEAFTAMRARGANITDIVVLVVASDDGVMPQTIEAIDHAKAANVSIVVAINKIDKQDSNPDRVKKQLMEIGLVAEDWGGKIIMVGVSARTKQGLEQLLEMLMLEAEILELKANPEGPASGTVIEGRLESRSGPVITVLVQNGTLYLGDTIVAGRYFGNIRAMIDDKGRRIKMAGPSTPVEILGFSGVCDAGDKFFAVDEERKAKEIVLERQERAGRTPVSAPYRLTLEDLHDIIQRGEIKELDLIIKSDVQGSLGALKESLEKLSTDSVTLKIIHAGIGDVNESDVMLAAASNAIIIGFHVDISSQAKAMAVQEGVDIRLYKIIYEVISAVRESLAGLLKPIAQEVPLGRAEVRQVFKVSKAGNIAGCLVVDGKIIRTAFVRIHRNKEVVCESKISSLKRFKDDAREAAKGMECGIAVSGFEDIKEGDIIEAYEIKEVAQTL